MFICIKRADHYLLGWFTTQKQKHRKIWERELFVFVIFLWAVFSVGFLDNKPTKKANKNKTKKWESRMGLFGLEPPPPPPSFTIF